MKKVQFSHGTWWLAFVRKGSKCLDHDSLNGTCDPPTAKGRKMIYVAEKLPPKQELEIVIHETLHAFDPRADETVIAEGGQVLANLLWSLGYRKTS